MQPKELQNLVKINALKPAIRDDNEIEQLLKIAQSMLVDSQKDLSDHSSYMLAYDGIHSLAMLCLLNYELRPSDTPGHRTLALQKFCELLDLGDGIMKVVTDAHNRRNETTYRSALPPISRKDADVVIRVLADAIPKAKNLVGK